MNAYGTPFTESEAILAATNDDWPAVRRLLAEMLPSERMALHRACTGVAEEIERGLP